MCNRFIPIPLASQSGLLEFLGSPTVITVSLIILMLLISALTVYILLALHLMRKNGEDAPVPSGTAPQDQEPEAVSRFSNLSRIDREQESRTQEEFQDMDLQELCHRFRNFAASRMGLYYEIEDIRRFVAGMGIGRLNILRGISGTGKTSLAYAAGAFFGNPSTVVPIQPMWKERSDILGYFNEFTKRFNETTLLCKLYEAGGRQDVYITVLDEVNISRIEYYFAEFLSLLELPDPKKRELDVVSDSWDTDPKRLKGGKLLLPENMWFIGTANNDDSTFAISDKVYDRAMVIDLDRKCAPFRAPDTAPVHISFAALSQRFEAAKQRYQLSQRNRENLQKLDAYLTQVFRVSFGNRILRQIEGYVPILFACGGTEVGALDDILSRKILRKLEQLSPALIKSEVPALGALLDQLFGTDTLPLSQEYLSRLMKSV